MSLWLQCLVQRYKLFPLQVSPYLPTEQTKLTQHVWEFDNLDRDESTSVISQPLETDCFLQQVCEKKRCVCLGNDVYILAYIAQFAHKHVHYVMYENSSDEQQVPIFLGTMLRSFGSILMTIYTFMENNTSCLDRKLTY